jgi:hypothetical protein
MAKWWSFGSKNKAKGNNNNKGQKIFDDSVAQHIHKKNAVVTEYSEAMKRLQTKGLTLEERYNDLVKTYRTGRDLMVVPTSWMGRDMIVNCPCKKIYVDTPVPSIVRTR